MNASEELAFDPIFFSICPNCKNRILRLSKQSQFCVCNQCKHISKIEFTETTEEPTDISIQNHNETLLDYKAQSIAESINPILRIGQKAKLQKKNYQVLASVILKKNFLSQESIIQFFLLQDSSQNQIILSCEEQHWCLFTLPKKEDLSGSGNTPSNPKINTSQFIKTSQWQVQNYFGEWTPEFANLFLEDKFKCSEYFLAPIRFLIFEEIEISKNIDAKEQAIPKKILTGKYLSIRQIEVAFQLLHSLKRPSQHVYYQSLISKDFFNDAKIIAAIFVTLLILIQSIFHFNQGPVILKTKLKPLRENQQNLILSSEPFKITDGPHQLKLSIQTYKTNNQKIHADSVAQTNKNHLEVSLLDIQNHREITRNLPLTTTSEQLQELLFSNISKSIYVLKLNYSDKESLPDQINLNVQYPVYSFKIFVLFLILILSPIFVSGIIQKIYRKWIFLSLYKQKVQ